MTTQPSPLRSEENGTIRVGNTLVTLDTVIGAFREGSTLEAIVERYPSLSLKDVYSVITYYLWNQGEVEKYLAQRRQKAENIRQEVEARFPSEGLPEKLLLQNKPRKISGC